MVLEKTLESPLDSMEIQPAHPKGNQPWIFIGRTYAEAETPILWPPDENWLTGKVSDAGKGWRQEDKGATDGWMASPTWWTWVWASSRTWWWIGRSGVLQSMGSQRVKQDWATELTEEKGCIFIASLPKLRPGNPFLPRHLAQLALRKRERERERERTPPNKQNQTNKKPEKSLV